MKEEILKKIVIAENKLSAAMHKLSAAMNAPIKYIAVDVDNASPEENKIIEQLVEKLNTKRELSYFLPIYEAAKNFVKTFDETFAESYELDKEL